MIHEGDDKPRQCAEKQRHYCAGKVCIVKPKAFPVVTYGFESSTVKKTEHRKIDALELWFWRRLNPLDSKDIKPVNLKGNQP